MSVGLPIRFINLDRAEERRAFMQRQGERFGLALERVRAVEANDIPAEEFRRLSRSWERPLSPGELACFLSHRAEWARVAEDNRPALILEDDAVFSPRLPEVLAVAAAIGGIDLLNLEDVGKRRFLAKGRGTPIAGGVELVGCRRDKAGAGAYLLWPAGARALVHRTAGRAGLADAILHGSGLRAGVCEPPVSMQLSVLEARGVRGEIDGRSLLQVPREKLAPSLANAAFFARRGAAQARLLPFHLRRVFDTDYRRTRAELSEFT